MQSERCREYLDHLGFSGEENPTLDALVENHLARVPFENLDAFQETETGLSEDELYERIVKRRRGGDCYQLNCGFWYLLKGLGYRVEFLACRVWAGPERGRKKQGFRAAPSHFALLVDDYYFVDVGLGEPPIAPIDIRGQVTTPDGAKYRVVLQESKAQLEWFIDDVWIPRLQWDTKPGNRWRRHDVPRQLEPDRNFILHSCDTPLNKKLVVCTISRHAKLTFSVSEQGARLKRTCPRFGPDKAVSITPIALEDIPNVLHDHFSIPHSESRFLDINLSLTAPPLWWDHL